MYHASNTARYACRASWARAARQTAARAAGRSCCVPRSPANCTSLHCPLLEQTCLHILQHGTCSAVAGCWRQNSPHTRSTSAAVFMADLAPDCGLVALPHLPPACERVPAGRRSCAGGWQRRTARMGSDSQTNVSKAESQCFCYGMRTGCARCRWRGHRCARGHAEGTGARCAQPLCWFDLAPLY